MQCRLALRAVSSSAPARRLTQADWADFERQLPDFEVDHGEDPWHRPPGAGLTSVHGPRVPVPVALFWVLAALREVGH